MDLRLLSIVKGLTLRTRVGSFKRFRIPRPSPWNGFSLELLDPVEAKCEEIRNLLKTSEPPVMHDMISVFVTRENLVLFTQLYGQHFQRTFSILHMPSFRLTQTPAILLLAIMIAGACYSNIQVPMIYISLGVQALAIIEDQPVSFPFA